MRTVKCPNCSFSFQTEKKFGLTCPECNHKFCGHEAEIYARVVGFCRPVKHWNKGKQEEFKERKSYKVPEHGLK